MYSFNEICTKVALMAQRSGDSDYINKIKDWVNLGHEYVANSYDFWSELQSIYTFSSSNGTEQYYLPSNFDKPYRLFDLTNNKKLIWRTREEYFDANIATISAGQTGMPQNAMLYGNSATVYSSAATFKVKSSNISDNSGITCRIEGWLNSERTIAGYEDIVISTSSPTTYVAGSVTFYGITHFSKSADTQGFVTLADSSGAIYANIAPVDRQSRYPVLYLGLIPGGAYDYEILYKRKVKKLVNDNDYPFMDCCDFLILYALGYAFSQEKESETRAAQMWQKADNLLGLIMRNEQDKMGPDFQHKFTNKTSQAHRY